VSGYGSSRGVIYDAVKIVAALAFATAALTGACSSQTVPHTGIACPALALEAPQQLYPIPGATGVPTTAGYLVVSGSVPSTVVVDLVPQSGAPLALGLLRAAPSPLPSPAATPNDPTAPLHSAPYPALMPATTYSVEYHDTARPCPLAIFNDAEPFTTQ
jgi:hypothetical protein